MCHLLLWRLGDKMRRHENMDGPSMGSPTETKTEPLQCIKLLPVQKQYYIVSGGSLLLLRLISDSVGAVLSERTRLAVMISDRSRDPYTPGECTSRTNVSGVLSKARGEADPGWEKVILKITLRGPERTSQIRPNVNVPADYSADNKGSATSSTKGLWVLGRTRQSTQLVCWGSYLRLLGVTKAERKPLPSLLLQKLLGCGPLEGHDPAADTQPC